MNERMSPILTLKLVAMPTSLEGSQNGITDYEAIHTPTNSENLVKIGPVDSEIRGLEVDH